MKKEQEIQIKKEINPIVRKVEAMEIVKQEDMSDATIVLSQLNKFGDSIKHEKEKLTKPINEALKEIRNRYRPIETTLEEAVLMLKKKMSIFQTEALAKEKEAQEKIAEKVASGDMDISKALTKLGKIDSPDEKVQTDEGSVGFRTMKKFEVMDITMLPMEYILPNEIAIRKAMNEGKELPGCRYWEEQSIINRRN